MKIVVLGAQPEWLSGLRGPLIRAFVARGHDVIAVGSAEVAVVRAAIESWGARYYVVPITRAGLNPLTDFQTLVSLIIFLRRHKPDILFSYTIKPIVYGMFAAKITKIPRRYGMITGRGYAFIIGKGVKRKIVKFFATILYSLSSRLGTGFIFHNSDDEKFFKTNRLVPRKLSTTCVGGSGIDLLQYPVLPMPEGPPVFLMVGRLIADKGVREFVEAGVEVKRRFPSATFRLVGPLDPSPNGIQVSELNEWQSAGIEYVGTSDDIRSELRASHVLILPSYAEGLPRSVLEAMSCGRPIITTDAPGCKDTVEHGINGFLVPVRDARAIVDAALTMAKNPFLIREMGAASRMLATKQFDVEKVNSDVCNFIGA